jgi:N4-(beta-N-acetylglucosaminyl)-L-asparaginase
MANCRNFFKTALASAAFALQSFKGTRETEDIANPRKLTNQLYFNLNFGMQANVAAWDVLKNNGKALDAVEAGENSEGSKKSEVGYGGRPDRDGRVT